MLDLLTLETGLRMSRHAQGQAMSECQLAVSSVYSPKGEASLLGTPLKQSVNQSK